MFAHLRRVHSADRDSDNYICLACAQMGCWGHFSCMHSKEEAREGLRYYDRRWLNLRESAEESAALHIASHYSAKESVGDNAAPAICVRKHCRRQVAAVSSCDQCSLSVSSCGLCSRHC